MNSVTFRIMFGLGAGATLLPAQATKTPARDGHALYTSFLSLYDSTATGAVARRRSAPEVLRLRFGLEQADHARLIPIVQKRMTELRASRTAWRSYVDASRATRTPLDNRRMREFRNQEALVVNAAMVEVRQALGRSGWERLSNYINNVHRQRVHAVTLGKR